AVMIENCQNDLATGLNSNSNTFPSWNELRTIFNPNIIAQYQAIYQSQQQNFHQQHHLNNPSPLFNHATQQSNTSNIHQTQYEPKNSYQNNHGTKRARNYSQPENQDNNQNKCQNDEKKSNFIIKFSSNQQFPTQLRSYLKLSNEIKRCLPNCNILNVYINQKNELVIKTDSEESMEKIKNSWPDDAFTHGVKLVNKKDPKFYIALQNVSLDFDITDQENLDYLQKEYNIIKAIRIVKKSTNEPLKTIKALINNKVAYETIIKASKIKIGNTYIRVKQWNFGIQPDQCFHCQKIGHKKHNCPNSNDPPTCVRCAKSGHTHEQCKIKDPKLYKCVNCQLNHPSCSRTCELLIQETNRKKALAEEKVQKTASSEFTRIQSSSNTVYNMRNTSNVDSLNKNFLNLLIDVLKNFNETLNSIEENPKFFSNLVKRNLGVNYANFVMNRLVSELDLNRSKASTSITLDDNYMEEENDNYE
ncbi:reverse transcriptase, partial [Brachionus plicatilis]